VVDLPASLGARNPVTTPGRTVNVKPLTASSWLLPRVLHFGFDLVVELRPLAVVAPSRAEATLASSGLSLRAELSESRAPARGAHHRRVLGRRTRRGQGPAISPSTQIRMMI